MGSRKKSMSLTIVGVDSGIVRTKLDGGNVVAGSEQLVAKDSKVI